jgi:hypothetical protein
MADAVERHRAELTPDILNEQVAALLRNQAGLWSAIATLSELWAVLSVEGGQERPTYSAH